MLVGNLGITANNFINSGGSVNADTFSLSVAGDFHYADNDLNNRNIDATTPDFRIGGDFSYDDAYNNFVWNASDSLVVLGSVFINADDFFNRGSIDCCIPIKKVLYCCNIKSIRIDCCTIHIVKISSCCNIEIIRNINS